MEAYYSIIDRSIKEKDEYGESYYHLVLLAQNNIGLKNLYKLSSKAYSEGMYRHPRADFELLKECSEGLMATSACLGSIFSQLILKNESQKAESLLKTFAELFKDRFFIELQLHEGEQKVVNTALMAMANKLSLPIILTQDCHYTNEFDKQLHEQALCMQTNSEMTNPKRFSFGDIDVHCASHEWVAHRAIEQSIPYEAISNTNYVADLIDDKDYYKDNWNHYPKYQKLVEGVTSYDELVYRAKEGLTAKFGGMPPEDYRNRLIDELHSIKKMGFCDYLLIVQDFIQNANKNGILTGIGRGSGAGSLVVYSLGITHVDPIQYGLLFSRFLNYGRSATPLIFTNKMKENLK